MRIKKNQEIVVGLWFMVFRVCAKNNILNNYCQTRMFDLLEI